MSDIHPNHHLGPEDRTCHHFIRALRQLVETAENADDAILAAPLIGDEKILGVIEVVNKHDAKLLATGDQETLTLFCHVAGESLHGILRRTSGR